MAVTRNDMELGSGTPSTMPEIKSVGTLCYCFLLHSCQRTTQSPRMLGNELFIIGTISQPIKANKPTTKIARGHHNESPYSQV